MTIDSTHFQPAPSRTCLWSCLLLLCLLRVPAWAQEPKAGFHVREADSALIDDVYQLRARIDYVLSAPVSDALVNGLPLVIELQVEVVRDYFGVWDHAIASLTQRYQLEYHALTREYLLKTLNSSAQRSFPTEQAALDALGEIDALPLLDKRLLKEDVQYDGRVRARLDIEALPTPLRLAAYLDSDWRLSSDWYSWPLRH